MTGREDQALDRPRSKLAALIPATGEHTPAHSGHGGRSGGSCVDLRGDRRAAGLGLLAHRAYTPPMERPVDAVMAAVLKLQLDQRAVNTLIREVTERVSAEPFGQSSLPDIRVRLSELRSEVDQAVDELMDGLGRMGDAVPPNSN